MREIEPIAEMTTRPAEAGRIRLGHKVKTKSGKMAPGKLTTLRFTSEWRDVLDDLQPHVGGTVAAWHDERASPADQFELISKVAEVPVYIIPGGMSIWYEKWEGSGCERRCDGLLVEVAVMHGDDADMVKVPCICRTEGILKCQPTTRLSVVLPQIRLRGVWRLESKGWNAKAELPGMVAMVEALNERGGIVQAVLGMRQVQRVIRGRKQNWVQPTLSIAQSVLELQAGLANATAIGARSTVSTVPALGTGKFRPGGPAWAEGLNGEGEEEVDDEIVEPDVFDDDFLAAVDTLRADAVNFGLDPERFTKALLAGVQHEKDGTPCSMERQRHRLEATHDKMLHDIWEPLGFNRDGTVQWNVKS